MNQNISINMKSRFFRSIDKFKLVLFLGMLFSFTVKSQNCQIINPANIVIIDASCNFGSDGQIDLSLLDPLGSYSYSWNGIPGSLDNVNLQAGLYTLRIIDLNNNSCIQDSSFTISTISTSVTVDTHVLCYGEATGQATVDNSFGTGPFLYDWSDGQTTQTATNLVAGIYTVTVTDDFDCIAVGTIEILNLFNPLSVSTTLHFDIICDGDSTGEAKAENAIGGVSTAPYTYLWDNGQTTQVAIDLWEGIHIVTVMDSAGCTAQSSIEIESLNDPIVGVYNIINHVSCFGGSDASVEFSSSGGVLQHSYQWSTGQTYVNGSGPDTAFNLGVGGYTVLIVDAEGCNHTVAFAIEHPTQLYAIADGNGAPIPNSVLYTQPVQCFGFDDGTAFASPVDGTPGYYFVWDSIQGVSANYNTGQNIDSLTPGIHTVYITDANGCTASDTVLITEPTELVVEINDSSVIYAYCLGTSSGELCAQASGGTPGYNYVWDDPTGQTTPCATNLNANIYTVTVYDDRSCNADDTFDLDSITNSFSEDSVVFLADSVSCFGLFDGQLTATSISGSSNYGGVAPYLYSWDGPSGYSGTGNAITTLEQGSYSVVITDDNDCVINTGTYLYQPDYFQFDIYNTVDETCDGSNNGQIYIEVEGGTGTYYYDTIFPGSSPITDTIIYNDSIIINLAPGTYSIFVTDDNGCEGAVMNGGDYQAEIGGGLEVDEPTSLDLILVPVSCFNLSDGSAEFINPNSLFTYTWELDDGTGIPDGFDVSNGAGSSWDGFSDGQDYFLVVHYADSASFGVPYAGCDQFVSFTLPTGPTQILPSISVVNNVSCYSGDTAKISLSSTGGVPPYTFEWDTTSAHPNGHQVLNVLDTDVEYLTNLTVGTYAATITDDSGCSVTVFETITEPDPLISDIVVLNHESCPGESDGQVEVIAVGATPFPGSILWSDGQSNPIATGLSADTFWVTLTDNNGCKFTDTVIVLQPAAPIASVEAVDLYVGEYDVKCYGESNAAAIVTGTGVSFEWTHVSTGTSFTTANYNTGPVLMEGDYDIIAYDINGCPGFESIYISEPPLLDVSVLTSNPSASYQISCFDEDDGWARVVNIDGTSLLANGGGVQANNSLGYYISWENNLGNNYGSDTIAENLPGNILPSITYTVTVQDANGCEDSYTTNPFIQPILFDVQVSTVNYSGPFHAPYAITFIDSTVSVETYTYDWTWHDGFESFYNVNAGDNELFTHDFSQEDVGENLVSVTVTNDVTGCEKTIDFIIEVQGFEDTLINLNVFTPNSDGINDEFVFSEYAMTSVDVQIFNRWGQMVKSWVGENKSWEGKGIDGSDLPEGVYFYMFKADGVDGHYYERKGSITLLR
jgi:gliding motility-associated-like protein